MVKLIIVASLYVNIGGHFFFEDLRLEELKG